MSFADRLSSLGLGLPSLPSPVANYLPYKLTGKTLYISGMIPLLGDDFVAKGRVGEGVDIETAQRCAMQCVLNGLAWVNEALRGDIERVFEVVQIRGFVACTADFTQHPQVINGASDLLVQIFGERGRHSRVAVGVQSLPLGVPVEIDFIYAVG
jgi:enamine deaminase RidA (YjgF/YER057c/UK114 family)